MKPIKRFVSGVVLEEINKSRFLCHTHRDDARRILDTFGDTFMGRAQTCNGASVAELHKAGIVGIYETF